MAHVASEIISSSSSGGSTRRGVVYDVDKYATPPRLLHNAPAAADHNIAMPYRDISTCRLMLRISLFSHPGRKQSIGEK